MKIGSQIPRKIPVANIAKEIADALDRKKLHVLKINDGRTAPPQPAQPSSSIIGKGEENAALTRGHSLGPMKRESIKITHAASKFPIKSRTIESAASLKNTKSCLEPIAKNRSTLQSLPK
jgi:hypothetical protein